MYCTMTLDVDGLRQVLDQWPTIRELPFHEARRASLLVELGEFDKAEQIAQEAITELRRRTNLKPITNDYTQISKESFVMLTLQLITESKHLGNKESKKDIHIKRQESERKKTLRQYECDPLAELNSIEKNLKISLSRRTKEVEKRRTFDGEVRLWRTFGQRITRPFSNY